VPGKPTIGLVCSGGGARGAYEAGVIRYLREELPASSRQHVRFDVLAGTSIGALTCCFLASTMDKPDQQGQFLQNVWTNFQIERVFKVEGENLVSAARKLWTAARAQERPEGWRLSDIMHMAELETVVRTSLSWPAIAANLARGLFSALAVSTTRLSDGKSVVFVQRREPGLPPWSLNPAIEAQETVLGPEHALASAAIPLLFRSVKIADDHYCDGSVRMATPLSPALRLGAERVLVLSLKSSSTGKKPPIRSTPTTALLVGKLLNAMLLDHTDHELDRMRRLNTLLEAGQQTYGSDFLERINATVTQMRGQPWRQVRELVLRPSRDLSEIAGRHARDHRFPINADTELPKRMLYRVTRSRFFRQSDIASYLMFDAAYASDLISLAMEDAHQRREELMAFFEP
jgi:NTE family protein